MESQPRDPTTEIFPRTIFPGLGLRTRRNGSYEDFVPGASFPFKACPSLVGTAGVRGGTSGHFGVVQGNNGARACLRCDLALRDSSHFS